MSRRRIERYQKHIDAVEAAYAEKLERVEKARPKNGKWNLIPKPRPNVDLHKIRRKCSAKRTDGQPCNAPAIKGAKRCIKHGGYRDNPAHPGAIKRLLGGLLHLSRESMVASDIWNEAPPEARSAVLRAEVKAGRITAQVVNRGAGVLAYQAIARDDGRAWRKWIATQAELLPPDE